MIREYLKVDIYPKLPSTSSELRYSITICSTKDKLEKRKKTKSVKFAFNARIQCHTDVTQYITLVHTSREMNIQVVTIVQFCTNILLCSCKKPRFSCIYLRRYKNKFIKHSEITSAILTLSYKPGD